VIQLHNVEISGIVRSISSSLRIVFFSVVNEYECMLNHEDVFLHEYVHTTEWMKRNRLHPTESNKYGRYSNMSFSTLSTFDLLSE
jgi:hypothetical protein